ncbi:MAG: lipid II flippase MurJ [Patescibacteria group bacterium]
MPLENLHDAALVLAISAIASQILALLRDRIFAHIFGAGTALDTYYAAFKIPDLLFTTVASLVSVSVLIPYFTREIERDAHRAHEFLDSIFTVFFSLITILSLLAFLFMPYIAPLVTPGFSLFARGEMIELSRILLLATLFLGLSGYVSSIVHTFRHFLVSALCPIFYNLGIILGALLLYPIFGLKGLVWGVVLGALFHLVIQLPVVINVGFFPKLIRRIAWSRVREVFLVSIPRTITLGVNQLVLIMITSMASFFAIGSITVFNLALNLQSVPLAVIGVSYSMSAFPTLSRLFISGERTAFAAQIGLAARNIIFWSLPVTALFIVLRAQIVRTILGTGAFDWTSTRLVAASLAIFALSALAQGLSFLFVRGYYASGNTRVPLLVNVFFGIAIIIFAFCLKFVFNESQMFRYFFETLFRVEGLSGTEVLMLPLAFSIGAIGNALVYCLLFVKNYPKEVSSFFRTFRHTFYSSVLMGFVSYECLAIFDNLFNLETLPGIFMQGLLSGIIGIIAGILLLRILKNEEIEELAVSLKRKFWKAQPVIPGPEEAR